MSHSLEKYLELQKKSKADRNSFALYSCSTLTLVAGILTEIEKRVAIYITSLLMIQKEQSKPTFMLEMATTNKKSDWPLGFSGIKISLRIKQLVGWKSKSLGMLSPKSIKQLYISIFQYSPVLDECVDILVQVIKLNNQYQCINNVFSSLYKITPAIQTPTTCCSLSEYEAYRELWIDGLVVYVRSVTSEISGLELDINTEMLEFNAMMPKRFRALVLRWGKVKEKATPHMHPVEPEFGVIVHINQQKGNRSISPVGIYKRRINKMKRSDSSRYNNYITQEVIGTCRLRKFEKYILKSQSTMKALGARWEELNNWLIKFNTTIDTLNR